MIWCILLTIMSEITVIRTPEFKKWFDELDNTDQIRIDVRVVRIQLGNFGDHGRVEKNLLELRIRTELRVYYSRRGDDVIFLYGGHTSRQSADIPKAITLWQQYKEMSNE